MDDVVRGCAWFCTSVLPAVPAVTERAAGVCERAKRVEEFVGKCVSQLCRTQTAG